MTFRSIFIKVKVKKVNSLSAPVTAEALAVGHAHVALPSSRCANKEVLKRPDLHV